jgi:enhancer of polycomb-like protein
MLERSLDLLEKNTGFETICLADRAEHLILSKIPQFLNLFPYKAPAGVVTAKHVVGDIYNYWVQKRSKLKRPLLRRFWPVTATDDTNPHLVFRPREKEKYKLRKKRQNDMDAYRKMKQLRSDFQHVRVLLDLVKRREELNRCMIHLRSDWFEQKMSDIVDTSGTLRLSSRLQRDEVERLLDVPRYFNVTSSVMENKKKKRKRGSDWDDSPFEPSSMPQAALGEETEESRSTAPAPPPAPANVAGKNHGEPAPLFVHPLKTRESYVTSWDNAVPLVTSYVNTHAAPTFRFRHRPRLGRGGRMCIDRIPHPGHPNITPVSVFIAGDGLVCSVEPKKQLLDLLPRPLDHADLSRKIEEMCVAAIQEDYETATFPPSAAAASLDAEENDCEEVLVKLNDWLDTDEQLWGEERFAIGPL